ncbi:phosphoesterase PA-phosphatase-like protein [Halogeometricum pallidum JCM 14848]|uniref:Phosphoesterase PA-phosphatase-like protein n=1 Tax=Halogeometricum pallidum JCM 14848 TaxID=1227487 RepID=M0CZ10_HALPD|nr:phosphatase PAP2 family protein [Halogeometricum pallidum]ELZ28455.1 phosphoesterase PA-phosphatase-like protein [Halogeometricum pallidum JCM 14848]
MALLDVVLQVGAGVFALLVTAAVLVVGPSRLRTAPRTVRANARAVAPVFIALVVVLAANGVIRDIGVELSWLIGLNITGYIHAIEGSTVAFVQSFATPALTAYFGFVYIFGYVFLLVFPLAAYAMYEESRPLRVVLFAYITNYGVGLLCYILFVAYGPRNFMPDMVQPLLYNSWPQAQLLTSQVNVNTNVFPSLHTSLSGTVALLAWRFRGVYPRWTPVAVFLGVSIAVSTMYLGIHWATDVAAGALVAFASVEAASRAADRQERGESLMPSRLRELRE